MATPYEVKPEKLIPELADDLKNNIKLKKPDWTSFIKTGAHKERQPDDENWWWMRSASILRQIYMKGPVGVQRLRGVYGGRKNRGVRPEKAYKGGGKIIRVILQEFDNIGFTEKADKGRRVTPKGQAYMDTLALRILKKTG